jgi:nucleotide-binding universal stress UspA family protein
MTTIQRIACAIDFSESSHQAMRTAAHLARERGAELVLLHAWEDPTVVAVDVTTPTFRTQVKQAAEGGLEQALRDTRALGKVAATVRLVEGTPWQAIVEVAERDPTIGLLVVGTLGRTGIKRAVLGSVAEQIVRHAPCPVLVVRRGSEPRPYRHVLVPVDFSQSSRAAMRFAAELVTGDARITLVHVLEVPTSYHGELNPPEALAAIDRRGASLLEEFVGELRGLTTATVDTHTRVGSPVHQVLAMVEHDPTYDLVVTGSHGRTGVGRFLLGSVAERLVRHAPAPVVVVHQRAVEPAR